MSLEAQIERLNVNLEKLLAAGGIASAPAAPEKPAKPAKAAPADKVASATKPETAAQTVANLTANTDKVEVTKDDINKCGEDLSKLAETNRAKAVAILGEFGVAKMTALKTELIPQLHAKVKAALGGAAEAVSLI